MLFYRNKKIVEAVFNLLDKKGVIENVISSEELSDVIEKSFDKLDYISIGYIYKYKLKKISKKSIMKLLPNSLDLGMQEKLCSLIVDALANIKVEEILYVLQTGDKTTETKDLHIFSFRDMLFKIGLEREQDEKDFEDFIISLFSFNENFYIGRNIIEIIDILFHEILRYEDNFSICNIHHLKFFVYDVLFESLFEHFLKEKFHGNYIRLSEIYIDALKKNDQDILEKLSFTEATLNSELPLYMDFFQKKLSGAEFSLAIYSGLRYYKGKYKFSDDSIKTSTFKKIKTISNEFFTTENTFLKSATLLKEDDIKNINKFTIFLINEENKMADNIEFSPMHIQYKKTNDNIEILDIAINPIFITI